MSTTDNRGMRLMQGIGPVGALERVVHQSALTDAPSRLTLRVSRKPVVGEDRIGRAMLLAVLEQGHSYPGHLRRSMFKGLSIPPLQCPSSRMVR